MNINLIKSKLGKGTPRKNGQEIIYKCPWCKKPKLEVNYNKLVFNCFRCSKGGSLNQLGAKLSEIGCNDAIYGSLAFTKIIARDLPQNRKIDLPNIKTVESYCQSFTINRLAANDAALLYLSGRGLDMADVLTYKMWTSDEYKFRNRIIIPIIEHNKPVCWVARAYDGSLPKEVSPKASESNKSHYVFNLDSVKLGSCLVIVEGIFDCIHLDKRGYNAVSIMGSNLSDTQAGKILSKRPSGIVLMYDGDEAGRKGWIKAHQLFSKRCAVPIYTIRLPHGKDPDQLTVTDLETLLLTEWGCKK
jgi:hypothetical protein